MSEIFLSYSRNDNTAASALRAQCSQLNAIPLVNLRRHR